MYTSWPCPRPDGGVGEEMVLAFDRQRASRILVIPPLFDEANKFRHQIYVTLKFLDRFELDGFCPDLPGCNESTLAHREQTLAAWRAASDAAAAHFRATHVLAFRSGAWLAPAAIPGWSLAAPLPAQVLRALLRSHVLAAREAGQTLSGPELLEAARHEGITIAGWELGAALIRELESDDYEPVEAHRQIAQADIGGTALWLRSENDSDHAQAEALAAIVADGVAVR